MGGNGPIFGGGGSGGSAGSMAGACSANADCAGDPGGPVCDLETGQCVSCLPAADPVADCGIGEWCRPKTGQCEPGCTADADCPSPGGPPTCDVAAHTCVACVPGSDEACYEGPPGSAGVGECTAGQRTCAPDGLAWGPCVGQVLPSPEDCLNGKDDDCDGMTDC